MLKANYSSLLDKHGDLSWENWTDESLKDNKRRFEELKDFCRGKSVLEFGCGNGGFLKQIKDIAEEVSGIELMEEARERLNSEGIRVYKSLSEINEKYDIICMFNVIEHLNNPDDILKDVHNALNEGGSFVCETCNVDCVLSSLYSCKAYEDFTYWSEHVILFNSETLEKMINRNGFRTEKNTQLERYSLGNHLFWLSQGKPGGHEKWKDFNDKEINKAYEKILVSKGIADTLWYIGTKK